MAAWQPQARTQPPASPAVLSTESHAALASSGLALKSEGIDSVLIGRRARACAWQLEWVGVSGRKNGWDMEERAPSGPADVPTEADARGRIIGGVSAGFLVLSFVLSTGCEPFMAPEPEPGIVQGASETVGLAYKGLTVQQITKNKTHSRVVITCYENCAGVRGQRAGVGCSFCIRGRPLRGGEVSEQSGGGEGENSRCKGPGVSV